MAVTSIQEKGRMLGVMHVPRKATQEAALQTVLAHPAASAFFVIALREIDALAARRPGGKVMLETPEPMRNASMRYGMFTLLAEHARSKGLAVIPAGHSWAESRRIKAYTETLLATGLPTGERNRRLEKTERETWVRELKRLDVLEVARRNEIAISARTNQLVRSIARKRPDLVIAGYAHHLEAVRYLASHYEDITPPSLAKILPENPMQGILARFDPAFVRKLDAHMKKIGERAREQMSGRA